MTEKQLERAEQSLPMYFRDMTPEQRKLWHEIRCRRMMNSCLVYSYTADSAWRNFTEVHGNTSYATPYVKELGIERVRELWDEQVADVQKATIVYGAYTDYEGSRYNAIRWADDEVM